MLLFLFDEFEMLANSATNVTRSKSLMAFDYKIGKGEATLLGAMRKVR